MDKSVLPSIAKLLKNKIVLSMIFLYLIVFACQALNNVLNPPPAPTPESTADQILGVPDLSQKGFLYRQGVTKFSYDPKSKTAMIKYQWIPSSDEESNEEGISSNIAQKIKSLFDSQYFNSVQFFIYLPHQDMYGNIHWEYYTDFTITSELVNKINWDNFDTSKLITISELQN